MDGICAALHEMWMSEKDSRCMLLQALSLSRLVSSSSMVHASGLTLTSLNVERLLHRARTSSYRGERSTLHSTTHPTYLQVHMEHVLATSQITYWKSEYLTVAVDSCARHPRQLSAHRQRVPSRLLATRIKQHLPHYSCFKLVIIFV